MPACQWRQRCRRRKGNWPPASLLRYHQASRGESRWRAGVREVERVGGPPRREASMHGWGPRTCVVGRLGFSGAGPGGQDPGAPWTWSFPRRSGGGRPRGAVPTAGQHGNQTQPWRRGAAARAPLTLIFPRPRGSQAWLSLMKRAARASRAPAVGRSRRTAAAVVALQPASTRTHQGRRASTGDARLEIWKTQTQSWIWALYIGVLGTQGFICRQFSRSHLILEG